MNLRHLLLAFTLAVPLTAAAAANTSMLRVTCAGDDVGAEVSINGKFKGECPLDMNVAPGMLKLRVEKKADASHERFFEQEIRMGEGVVKKVEAVLTTRLTVAGQKIEGQRLAAEAEAELWNEADLSYDKTALEAYLNRYPSGRYIAAARAKLIVIKDEEAKPVIGPVMVRIPGKNYELGKYEVSQSKWKAVMGNNPSQFSDCGDTCPVENMGWDDIQTFLQKLNAKTGKQYRLPTEAEWEYACYGGSQTEYCGGNDVNTVAWTNANSNNTTHLVGQKQANGYGLYDMSGNVWEWMNDCWDENCAVGHVVRGGSSGGTPVSASFRGRYETSLLRYYFAVGFRLARTLPQ